MKEQISALIDSQLEHEETLRLLATQERIELKNCCRTYRLIGDVLRDEQALDIDITDVVMARLLQEPTVLAPPRRPKWRRPALALAASVAGVAVVAWLALSQQKPATPLLAQAGTGAPQTVATHEMREYLIAHQVQSASLQFHGGAGHIRTVSLDATK